MPACAVRRTSRVLLAAAVGAAASALALPAVGTAVPAVAVAKYDLGVTKVRQPDLIASLRQMPIRFWGAIAAPTAPGTYPLVIVAHGAHGTGCPGEYEDWPCFPREKRADLGMTYLVRAIAQAGFVAVAADYNAGYTGGWGEVNETQRWNQVTDITITRLRAANAGGNAFKVPLTGKIDFTRIGLVGHSRGGKNVLRWAKGKPAVKSLVLVAPAIDDAVAPVDVPTTLVLGTCDGDTGLQGLGYFTPSRTRGRTTKVWRILGEGLNHNNYNQTLVRLRQDDFTPKATGPCSKSKRPRPAVQQNLLSKVTVESLTSTMLGAPPPAWQTSPYPSTLYGVAVRIRTLGPA